MADLQKAATALESRGYTVHMFSTAAEAAAWLNAKIDGTTVGFGGSATLRDMGLYESLSAHNIVHWHWKSDDDMAARHAAMTDRVYCTSVNALAESGEMVSIDGMGNRLASMLFGHETVYYVIGRNKLAPTYEEAVWRARNVAAPRRAQQMGRKTPCAMKADRCYDCKSPDRVCRGMTTLWAPMTGMAAEVLLIDEELGL